MTIDNKFMKAILAGIIAGTVKDIPNAFLHHYPRIIEITLWDYAGTAALGRLPVGFGEHAYAFFLELLFCIFLSLFYVNYHVLPQFGRDHHKLKGILYGAFVWFLIRGVVLAFEITPLLGENLLTSLVNLLVSMLFGCILDCSLRRLDQKMP
jgi:hypothetical protein